MTDWKISNLLFPSTIRCGKLATLSVNLVKSKIGELTKTDKSEVVSALERLVTSIKGS